MIRNHIGRINSLFDVFQAPIDAGNAEDRRTNTNNKDDSEVTDDKRDSTLEKNDPNRHIGAALLAELADHESRLR